MTVIKFLLAICFFFHLKYFENKETQAQKTDEGYVKVFGKIEDSLKPLENAKI